MKTRYRRRSGRAARLEIRSPFPTVILIFIILTLALLTQLLDKTFGSDEEDVILGGQAQFKLTVARRKQ